MLVNSCRVIVLSNCLLCRYVVPSADIACTATSVLQYKVMTAHFDLHVKKDVMHALVNGSQESTLC